MTGVIRHLDDALAELEKMDASIGVYKTQLSVSEQCSDHGMATNALSAGRQLMTDDIAHIEGQNRGLQVQTSNQRMLLSELDNLMVRLFGISLRW